MDQSDIADAGSDDQRTRAVRRRTVTLGAAWVVPTVAIASAAPALAASTDLMATARWRILGDCGSVTSNINNYRTTISFDTASSSGTPPVNDSWSFTSPTSTAPTSVCVTIYVPACYGIYAPTNAAYLANPTAWTAGGVLAASGTGWSGSAPRFPSSDQSFGGIPYLAYRTCTNPPTSYGWNYAGGVWSLGYHLIWLGITFTLRADRNTCGLGPWTPCPCGVSMGYPIYIERRVVQGGDNYVSWGSSPNSPCAHGPI